MHIRSVDCNTLLLLFRIQILHEIVTNCMDYTWCMNLYLSTDGKIMYNFFNSIIFSDV